MKTLGVYSYIWRGVDYDLPFIEMIESVLPVADEVCILIDSKCNDGSAEAVKAVGNDRVNIYREDIDLDNPCVDGASKAKVRSKCQSDILLQMDADEILRPEDYRKIRALKQYWPTGCRMIVAGVINWFNGDHLKLSAAGWVKERFSVNDPNITHGVPTELRIPGPGRYYHTDIEKSDGAGYITAAGRSVPADRYICKDVWDPASIYVHHYSWYGVPRKWEMNAWPYFWGILGGKYTSLEDYGRKTGSDIWKPVRRLDDAECVKRLKLEMKDKSIVKAKNIDHPPVMKDWLERQRVYVPGCWWKFRKPVQKNLDRTRS